MLINFKYQMKNNRRIISIIEKSLCLANKN